MRRSTLAPHTFALLSLWCHMPETARAPASGSSVGGLEPVLEADLKQRREFKRYTMELPLLFTWSAEGRLRGRAQGVSRNLSAGGVFFLTRAQPPLGASIHLQVFLPPLVQGALPLCIEAEGRVVRVEPAARGEGKNGIAVANVHPVLRQWGAIHEESETRHERGG